MNSNFYLHSACCDVICCDNVGWLVILYLSKFGNSTLEVSVEDGCEAIVEADKDVQHLGMLVKVRRLFDRTQYIGVRRR